MNLISSLPLILGALAVGALIYLAAHEGVRSLPGAARWLTASIAPLRRAGDEGYVPDQTERRRLALLASGTTLVVIVLVTGLGPLMLLAIAGPSLALTLIERRRSHYRLRVETAIPEVTSAVGDALAGGASLRGALSEAGRSLQGPPAKEFARVRIDLEMGLTAREALEGLTERLSSERIDALVSLLVSGTASGGDLVLLLRRFGEADLSRRRALRDANSATAQARYTGMLVVALPAGAALFAELVRPGFFAGILGDPAASMLLLLAVLLQFVGLFIVRRLGRAAER